MKKSNTCVTNPEALPMVLTPSDICNVLGISRNTAYEYMHSDGFPAFKVGKQYRVSKKRFLAWLDGNDAA